MELLPENVLSYQLVTLGLSDRARPLMLEVLNAEDLPDELRRVVLGRVIHALFSAELDEALKGRSARESSAKGK